MTHRFSKCLVFLFVNTSNVFYDRNRDDYFFYDENGYDAHNNCRNKRSILLKLYVRGGVSY